jgi:hypothetical protein
MGGCLQTPRLMSLVCWLFFAFAALGFPGNWDFERGIYKCALSPPGRWFSYYRYSCAVCYYIRGTTVVVAIRSRVVAVVGAELVEVAEIIYLYGESDLHGWCLCSVLKPTIFSWQSPGWQKNAGQTQYGHGEARLDLRDAKTCLTGAQLALWQSSGLTAFYRSFHNFAQTQPHIFRNSKFEIHYHHPHSCFSYRSLARSSYLVCSVQIASVS